MADQKISQLTDLATPDSADELPIVDTSAVTTKKITWANIMSAIGLSAYFNKSSDDLDDITAGSTNKHFTSTDETKLDGIASGATANSPDATLLARANHTGTQSADTITDGTTNKAYTATEKTKLSGIESGADVTDAANVASAGAAMSGGAFHDGFSDFVANEHIDWTADQGATNIHSGNIPDISASYAVAAKGVTNGDSHNHDGGDGAQIAHTALSSIGTNTHAQIDTHLGSTSNPHSVTASQAGAVATTGNETIAGIKTFSSSPIVPAPTTDLQVATKKYVDDNAGGTPEGTAVKSTGETGGSKFLREDGDGTCSWQTVSGSGTPGGSDTYVQFNDGGSLGGDSGMVYNKTTDKLTVTNLEVHGEAIVEISDIYGANGDGAEAGYNVGMTAGDGGDVSGAGGWSFIKAGSAVAGNSNGGSVQIELGEKSGSGTDGKLYIIPKGGSAAVAVIDVDSIATTDKTFTFPNASGNVVIDSATQTLTNKTLTSPKINEDVAITATATELNYCDGVTSAIQTQLNGKAASLGADDNYVTDAEKTVIGNTSGTNTGDEPDASDTVKGIVELAVASEVTTGTDAGRAVTPDALAGSVYGKRVVQIQVTDPNGDAITTGDGKAYFFVPTELNGYNLVDADACVTTVSSSGNPAIQVRNVTDSQDMLSTAITIDASEKTSYTAATAPVINGSYDDVATGDQIAIDIDTAGTGTKGLCVILSFQLP